MRSVEDYEMSGYGDLEMCISEDFMMSIPKDAKLVCYCGHPAKLFVSKTIRNPFRLFYVCPKASDIQCGYFQWADESLLADDRHIKELNLIGYQCTQLQERLEEIEREKSELLTKLSAVQAELDEIKKIKTVDESKLMEPPDTGVNKVSDDAEVMDAVSAAVLPTN